MINKDKLKWRLWGYELLKEVPLTIAPIYFIIKGNVALSLSFLILALYVGHLYDLYDLKWKEFKKQI